MDSKELYKLYEQHPVITTDSRNCPEGSIFIALKGASFDGNKFAKAALEKGCSYAIIDEKEYAEVGNDRIILVDDALVAYKEIARAHRRTFQIPVIGITGTNGKTTSKELISAVLAEKFNVLHTEGNFNNDVGVPKTLLRLRPEHEIAVIEMGASHRGDITKLVEYVEPTCGLITNVGRAHLQGFGSFEGVKQTKGELYDYLKAHNCLLFLNESNADLAEMMVGRSVSFKTAKQAAQPKDVVLSIKDLVVNENRGVPAVKNLSLDVCAGEIVGIAGIDGNGQSELIQAITGLRKIESGSIDLKGKSIVGLHPRKITEMSVGHVPEDRHRDGLILDMMISENIALQTYYKEPLSKNGILNYANITSHAKKLMEEFDVRAASEFVPAAALSGGNQQKAIIAREIDRDPDLLIVSQPTRGLDVGAIEYIHKRLIEERDNGKAVLVVSFELDEILNVSDRIAVIHDGKIQGIVSPETTNKQELGILMAGGNLGKEKDDV